MGPDPAEAGDDRSVIAEATVAVELTKVAADHLDVVGGLRAGGMAGDPNRVPRRQAAVDLLQNAVAVLREALELLAVRISVGAILQSGDLPIQFDDGLLEGQTVRSGVCLDLGHEASIVGVGYEVWWR